MKNVLSVATSGFIHLCCDGSAKLAFFYQGIFLVVKPVLSFFYVFYWCSKSEPLLLRNAPCGETFVLIFFFPLQGCLLIQVLGRDHAMQKQERLMVKPLIKPIEVSQR